MAAAALVPGEGHRSHQREETPAAPNISSSGTGPWLWKARLGGTNLGPAVLTHVGAGFAKGPESRLPEQLCWRWCRWWRWLAPVQTSWWHQSVWSRQLSVALVGVTEAEVSRAALAVSRVQAGCRVSLCTPVATPAPWASGRGCGREGRPSASAAPPTVALVFSLRALWSLIYILCTFFSKITKDVTQR